MTDELLLFIMSSDPFTFEQKGPFCYGTLIFKCRGFIILFTDAYYGKCIHMTRHAVNTCLPQLSETGDIPINSNDCYANVCLI